MKRWLAGTLLATGVVVPILLWGESRPSAMASPPAKQSIYLTWPGAPTTYVVPTTTTESTSTTTTVPSSTSDTPSSTTPAPPPSVQPTQSSPIDSGFITAVVIVLALGGGAFAGVLHKRPQRQSRIPNAEQPTTAAPRAIRPPVEPQRLQPGDPRAFGSYRNRKRLGQGGMGVVYLVTRGGKLYAVKTLLVGDNEQEADDLAKRFGREIALVSSLEPSRYLTPIIAYDLGGDKPYFVMEFVNALSLSRLLTKHYKNGMPDDELLALFLGLAQGLVQLHDKNIVHRDLKPGNVLMPAEGPKLIDFGIARAADGTRITSTNVLVGTPAYMAPEYLQNAQLLSPASDIFSVGAVMVFAATGNAPFTGTNDAQILLAIANSEPDFDRVPLVIRSLVRQCMRKDPDERPTALELREMLARIINA